MPEISLFVKFVYTQALLAKCKLSCLAALAHGVSENAVHM